MIMLYHNIWQFCLLKTGTGALLQQLRGVSGDYNRPASISYALLTYHKR